MGAKDFTELYSWQRSKQLQVIVHELVTRPKAARERKFCEQIGDSADSAPRNIAEGFGRFEGKEFAQFLKVAIASLFETRNHLLDARERGFMTREECDAAVVLTRRAITAATRHRAYLLSPRNRISGGRSYKDRTPDL
jgi:four helix bundle protein